MEALKEFIKTKCQGYAENAGQSTFMMVPLSQLNKEELLALIWYQEQENKSRLGQVERSSLLLGAMSISSSK